MLSQEQNFLKVDNLGKCTIGNYLDTHLLNTVLNVHLLCFIVVLFIFQLVNLPPKNLLSSMPTQIEVKLIT